MCTLSWKRSENTSSPQGDYVLLFNRDEQRSRPAAEPPKLHQTGTRKWISATDPAGGGTWLAVNQSGLSLALLNSYQSAHRRHSHQCGEPHRSRGLLVSELIGELTSAPHNDDWFASRFVPERYRPFFLVFIDLNDEQLWHWDGENLEQIETFERMWSTSSFQPESVIPWRKERFRELGSSEEFHCFHDPDQPAHSIRMSRQDACTVSLSKIRVRANCEKPEIVYRYAEKPNWSWQAPVVLASKKRPPPP